MWKNKYTYNWAFKIAVVFSFLFFLSCDKKDETDVGSVELGLKNIRLLVGEEEYAPIYKNENSYFFIFPENVDVSNCILLYEGDGLVSIDDSICNYSNPIIDLANLKDGVSVKVETGGGQIFICFESSK